MGSIRSTSKFRLMMLWTIICLSIFLFIVPSFAQAKSAAGSGIDWSKPWLDWQVQNCVRRYLRERVLVMENEEQRRNNKPVFTHIDEWGRLLNQYITPHGKVDGNWENPTHYVWYAYNLDSARRKYGFTVEEWVKRFCLPDQTGSGAGTQPAGTGKNTRDDEGSPFDKDHQQFIQTLTGRDETRTSEVQNQMNVDTLASYTRDKDKFGGNLSDKLDEVHPGTQSTEETTAAVTPIDASGEQVEISDTGCETVALNPANWRQLQYNRGSISQGQGGLVLYGDEWTNGKIKNGKLDGNGVESTKEFDLKNGGSIYMTFKVNDGGKYLGIFPKIFSEAEYKLLTTDHVWAGSIVVPSNVNLYARFKVDASGNYKTVVCNGNYDDKGGSSISQYSGTLKNRTGRVRIRFVDNYAGKNANLTILHAQVCIEKAAVKTSLPTQPSTTPEFKCKSNQDCWTHYSSNQYYCNKGTGECIKCPEGSHGKKDGTAACCFD